MNAFNAGEYNTLLIIIQLTNTRQILLRTYVSVPKSAITFPTWFLHSSVT